MTRLTRSSYRSFATTLAIASFAALEGCASPSEADPGGASEEEVSEANLTSGIKARRELSFKCPSTKGPIRVAFFDADSTLRVSKMGAVTANTVDDVDILPFAAGAIRARTKEGFLVAIVSNQGGVAAGKTTLEVAEGALLTTVRKLGELGAQVNYFDFAEGDNEDRKPGTGMATRLEETLQTKCGRGIDKKLSTMTGDSGFKKDVDKDNAKGEPDDDFSNSDRLFAENFGIAFAEPKDAFGWKDRFGVFNVLGESELKLMLTSMTATAVKLRTLGKLAEADEIDAEVVANRKTNGLTL